MTSRRDFLRTASVGGLLIFAPQFGRFYRETPRWRPRYVRMGVRDDGIDLEVSSDQLTWRKPTEREWRELLDDGAIRFRKDAITFGYWGDQIEPYETFIGSGSVLRETPTRPRFAIA